MDIRTTTKGEENLPRYFTAVFDTANRMRHGRLDMVLPDGRVFRAAGHGPGPVAELHIHNPEIFARLIREGDLGFCEAYLDEWWSTPDLQAFMDLVHADNEEVNRRCPLRHRAPSAAPWVELHRLLRSQSKSKRAGEKGTSRHPLVLPGHDFYAALAGLIP